MSHAGTATTDVARRRLALEDHHPAAQMTLYSSDTNHASKWPKFPGRHMGPIVSILPPSCVVVALSFARRCEVTTTANGRESFFEEMKKNKALQYKYSGFQKGVATQIRNRLI